MRPREALKGHLIDPTSLSQFHNTIKKHKKKIVFTAGNWDLLHVGQMRYLAQAKKHGDVLVVGVQSNEAVKKVKGSNKPILDEYIRCESLIFLKSVDYVTINPIPSCQPILELLKPDVFITVKEDWAKGYKESKEYRIVSSYGGKVEVVDRQSPFVSTSKIIARTVGGELGDLLKKYVANENKPIKERFGGSKKQK